jgi:hypothetical protein
MAQPGASAQRSGPPTVVPRRTVPAPRSRIDNDLLRLQIAEVIVADVERRASNFGDLQFVRTR